MTASLEMTSYLPSVEICAVLLPGLRSARPRSSRNGIRTITGLAGGSLMALHGLSTFFLRTVSDLSPVERRLWWPASPSEPSDPSQPHFEEPPMNLRRLIRRTVTAGVAFALAGVLLQSPAVPAQAAVGGSGPYPADYETTLRLRNHTIYR